MILPDSKLFSVSAGIATEKLFQDKNRSGPKFNFLEQQFWMYFYGSIVNWTAHSLYDSDHDLMSVAFSLLGKKKFHKFMDVSVSVSCVLLCILQYIAHRIYGHHLYGHCWASHYSQGFEDKNLKSSPGLLGQ